MEALDKIIIMTTATDNEMIPSVYIPGWPNVWHGICSS